MLAVATASVGGCTGDDLDPAQAAEVEVEPLRLGRVHVLLEPDADLAEELDDDYVDPLEVTARFAFVRGLEEEFVRARVDMPVMPTEALSPTECVASESLTAVDLLEPQGSELQELHLVDAGELRMQIGNDPERAFDVPVSLVPDLLPYMTGFEYLYYGEQAPELSDETTPVVVEARGSQTEELPPFRVEGLVPPALVPHASEADRRELSRGEALVVRWAGAPEAEGSDELVTLRLTGVQGNEPVGGELTCVVADAGQTRLSLDTLRTLGLSLEAQALRVTVSRLQVAHFDVGEFVGSELLVERRERLVLPLR